MAPDGLYVLVGGSRRAIFQAIVFGPLVSIASKKKMGINPLNVNDEDLGFLLALHQKGKLLLVIERRIDLSKVPEALTDFQRGS